MLGRRLAKQVGHMFRLMVEIALVHQDQSQTRQEIDMARIILEIDLEPTIIQETDWVIIQDLAVELAPLVAIPEVKVDLASKAASSTTTIILLQIENLEIHLQELVQAQLDPVALLREAIKVQTNHLLWLPCRIKIG